MSFEGLIKKISSIVAAVVVFFFAAGLYLSLKGYVIDENHNITFVKPAQASEAAAGGYVSTHIDSDLVLPSGQVLGQVDAPVTIYEYSSLGCGHCSDFHLYTLPKIKEEYIDTGKVKLIFVDFPIDKKSMMATMISRCATEDRYFDFINLLFKKQREWWLTSNTEKVLKQYAALSGIGQDKAAACLQDKDVAQGILNNRQQAVNDLKIQGTPAFIIDSNKDRELLAGAQSLETMRNILNQHLGTESEEK